VTLFGVFNYADTDDMAASLGKCIDSAFAILDGAAQLDT